jgi:hypothetical protein
LALIRPNAGFDFLPAYYEESMITPREYFAAHAIAPVYADLRSNNYEEVDFETIARLSFRLADQMLKQTVQDENTSGSLRFAGWSNLYRDGDLGIITMNKDELPESGDATVVRVYIEHDRTDKAL